MSIGRMMGFSGVLMLLSSLVLVVPGCGGGAQETGPTGEVKLAPVTNPAPGVNEPESANPKP